MEGCLFEKEFILETDDCAVDVYFPNIFSPNNDGINDLFQAFGDDISPRTLKIFDRWGSLIFSAEGDSAVWDGTFNKQKVVTGVYVFFFQYINTLTGQEEERSGEIMLVQ